MATVDWATIKDVLRRREIWAGAAVIVCGTAIWQFSSRGEVAVNENSIETMRFADLSERPKPKRSQRHEVRLPAGVLSANESAAAAQAADTAVETGASNQHEGGVLRAAFEAVQPESPPAWLTGVIEEE